MPGNVLMVASFPGIIKWGIFSDIFGTFLLTITHEEERKACLVIAENNDVVKSILLRKGMANEA